MTNSLKYRSNPFVYVDEDDDDDDHDEEDSRTETMSSKTTNGGKRDDNRRRAAHTAAEQKRRNAIRVHKTYFSLTMIILNFSFQKGYDALQSLVPNSHLLDPISSQKVSKAAILKRCKSEMCIEEILQFYADL